MATKYPSSIIPAKETFINVATYQLGLDFTKAIILARARLLFAGFVARLRGMTYRDVTFCMSAAVREYRCRAKKRLAHSSSRQ